MCRAIAFCLAVAAFMPLEYALAGDTDDSLRLYAVNIVQDPPQPWPTFEETEKGRVVEELDRQLFEVVVVPVPEVRDDSRTRSCHLSPQGGGFSLPA